MQSADERFQASNSSARLLEQRSELVLAEQSYQGLAKQYPDRYEVYQRLGIIAQKRGNKEEALRNLKKAQSLTPLNAEVLADVGYAEYLAGNFPQAVETLRQAQELNPTHPRIQANLAMALVAAGDVTTAHRLFRHTEDEVGALVSLGFALIQHGKLEEGRSAFEQAMQLDPHNAKAAEALVQLAEMPSQTVAASSNLSKLGIAVRDGQEIADEEGLTILSDVNVTHASKVQFDHPSQSVAPGGSRVSDDPQFAHFKSRHEMAAGEAGEFGRHPQANVPDGWVALHKSEATPVGVSTANPRNNVQLEVPENVPGHARVDRSEPSRLFISTSHLREFPADPEAQTAIVDRTSVHGNGSTRIQAAGLTEHQQTFPENRSDAAGVSTLTPARFTEVVAVPVPSANSLDSRSATANVSKGEQLMANSRGAAQPSIARSESVQSMSNSSSGKFASRWVSVDEPPVVAAKDIPLTVQTHSQVYPAESPDPNDHRWQIAVSQLADQEQLAVALRVIAELITSRPVEQRLAAWKLIQQAGTRAQVAGPALVELSSTTSGLETVESAYAIFKIYHWGDYAQRRIATLANSRDEEVRRRASLVLDSIRENE